MLIYTSGTTGRPKGAVHVHGGFPIKGAQDLAHCFDLGRGDTLFWFTDLGWMMGPWAISGSLLLGARLVLYEGVPDHPGPDRLWAIVERHRVTHLGLSPTVIRALMAHGTEPVRAHDRSSLRVLGSTGEPWNPEPWWWYFREVGEGRCPVINYSGGTEVSGGIVGCNLLTPIKPAAFGGPSIGDGRRRASSRTASSVRGVVGELAIRQPLAGHDARLLARPGALRGRVLVAACPGRGSTATGRHRRGRLLVHPGPIGRHAQGRRQARRPGRGRERGRPPPAVLEAAAVGVPHEVKGEVIVVFCVLRPGVTGDDELRAAISAAVAAELGRALRPDAVEVVTALPKTRSGKVMRRVARAAYLHLDPGDLSALENPAAVDAIEGLARRPR